MNKIKHPTDRSRRLLINEQKKKIRDKERAGKVWRKVYKEQIKEQESEDELRTALDRDTLSP